MAAAKQARVQILSCIDGLVWTEKKLQETDPRDENSIDEILQEYKAAADNYRARTKKSFSLFDDAFLKYSARLSRFSKDRIFQSEEESSPGH